jgi:hypothetical protein
MIAALLLALALEAGTGDAAPVGAPASEVTMMIVELPRGARFVGLPRRCPGATDDDGPNDLCLADLRDGPGSSATFPVLDSRGGNCSDLRPTPGAGRRALGCWLRRGPSKIRE